MTQFASESFDGVSGTTLQAYSADWIKHTAATGDSYISSSGRLRISNTLASLYYHTTPPASADYEVSGDVVFLTYASACSAGVAGRIDPSSNTLYFGQWHTDSGWRLFKIVNNISSQLGSSVAETISGTRKIRLRMEGSTISLYRDAETTPIISVTDTSITAAGYAGTRLGGASPGSVNLDNFSADTLGSGTTDATADGGTGTGTGSGTGGDATGSAGGDASTSGGTGTGTGSGTGGDATGGTSGSFTSSPMYSSGILQSSVALDWTWYPGEIGAAPPSALVHGSGSTSASGTLTASSLPTGTGFLLAETADGAIYYEAGTVT